MVRDQRIIYFNPIVCLQVGHNIGIGTFLLLPSLFIYQSVLDLLSADPAVYAHFLEKTAIFVSWISLLTGVSTWLFSYSFFSGCINFTYQYYIFGILTMHKGTKPSLIAYLGEINSLPLPLASREVSVAFTTFINWFQKPVCRQDQLIDVKYHFCFRHSFSC